MTDNEIIKALECHSCSAVAKCQCCPYRHKAECGHNLTVDALDLINRQKAEIERLKAEINGMEIGIKIASKKVKISAYKEFADELEYEMLHKEFWNDHPSTSEIWLNGYEQCLRDMRAMLKDKVKEMVGDG